MSQGRMLLLATTLGAAGMLALTIGPASRAAGQVGSKKAARRDCSKATLQGEYLFTGRVDSRSDLPNPMRPLVFAGVRTFDGQGSLSQVETVSRGGEILRGEGGKGTYRLDSNCIGTMTIAGLAGSSAPIRTFDIFLTADGSEGVAVGTNEGGIATHTLKRRHGGSE